MSEMTIQWIVVGAVVALCLWRVIWAVRARRRGRGGCSCDSGRASDCADGCAGCPLADKCRK